MKLWLSNRLFFYDNDFKYLLHLTYFFSLLVLFVSKDPQHPVVARWRPPILKKTPLKIEEKLIIIIFIFSLIYYHERNYKLKHEFLSHLLFTCFLCKMVWILVQKKFSVFVLFSLRRSATVGRLNDTTFPWWVQMQSEVIDWINMHADDLHGELQNKQWF